MNKIPKQWRGAISYNKKLTDEAVICLFEDSWNASPTAAHSHNVNFLHFRKNTLTRKVFPLAKQYFTLCKKEKNMDQYSKKAEKVRDEIWKIQQKINETKDLTERKLLVW
jgi:hypothetical protein